MVTGSLSSVLVKLTIAIRWSRIVQAIDRFHWSHTSDLKTNSGSSNNETLILSGEESPPAQPSRSTTLNSGITGSDGSSSDEVSPPGSLGDVPTDEDNALNSVDEDNTPTINDVESLSKGIIKTFKNKQNKPYTILLVGETGVGKSSVLELIAHVLTGKDIGRCDFSILDHDNEQGGSDNQSQTKSARLYELTSQNGIVVRILDTPGLADTRGIEQDELHKKSIATQIEQHINHVTAVLILANGTVPRVTVGTDYALSTLSAIFPKSLARNMSFMFTNVLGLLHWNFSVETLPDALKEARQFLLNNPIALQKKYLELKGQPRMKKGIANFHNAVKAAEQNALEMLVELFDWLDGLEPQPTTELVEKTQKTKTKIIDLALSDGEARYSTDVNQKRHPTSLWRIQRTKPIRASS